MDMYREGYRRAQDSAERVLQIKKGHYLETVSPEDIGIDAYSPVIDNWSRLFGFRRKKDSGQGPSDLQLATSEWIRTAVGSGRTAAFLMMRKEGKLSVLYGAGQDYSEGTFKAVIPECDMRHADPAGSEFAYNGVVTGTIRSKGLADAFASSVTGDAYVSCTLIPLSHEEVQDKLEENGSLLSYFDTYKSFQRTYGNATRRVEEVPVQSVVRAIALLKEENDYLERNRGTGFVRTVVRFGAKTENDLRNLAAVIQSCIEFDHDPQSAFEPSRAFTLRQACWSLRYCLAVPYVHIVNGHFSGTLYTLTLQDIQSAASFCLPPVNSYDGYYVKDYDIGEEAKEAFPITRPIAEDGVELGPIYGSNTKSVIPFSALQAHALVAGATTTGKTTTLKKLLDGLHTAGIPFTVIEAAKKEYSSLVGSIPELRVYTPGNDGQMLKFNPLQPEDGELIENHVAAVVRALIATTGGEHPIPEAYDGLLKQTYHKFGWDYGMMAYTDEHRPFPSFKDVFDNVDSYIRDHARYGPEVRQNLTAALALRTENMHSGAIGRLFREPAGLQAPDILEAPCVIELADFSPQSAAFIMNILLFKFHSYLSRQPECSRLKRVIVVEEAHNIFKRTLSEDTGRALNNEYFDKMLAEIRSSGTGLILSDQMPGIMSDAVIANTSVKIVHAITDGNDRRTIGEPANLSDFQLKKLGDFERGECIVAIRGHYGVQHVRVEAAREDQEYNAACILCTTRFRCRREAARRILHDMDDRRAAYHVSRIKADLYNPTKLEAHITDMLRDLNVIASDPTKTCLLGEVLDAYSSSSMKDKRVIVNTYSNYLKRRYTYE